MQTREQQYAGSAFVHVQQLLGNPRSEQKKYGAMAHQLPILIRTAGLAQALAFIEARGDKMHQRLVAHVAATVADPTYDPTQPTTPVVESTRRATLVSQSRTTHFAEYMRLSQKMMAALLWYKRFAQSVLDVKDATADETEVEAAQNASATTLEPTGGLQPVGGTHAAD